jgi:predicted nucleotidyltransferase
MLLSLSEWDVSSGVMGFLLLFSIYVPCKSINPVKKCSRISTLTNQFVSLPISKNIFSFWIDFLIISHSFDSMQAELSIPVQNTVNELRQSLDPIFLKYNLNKVTLFGSLSKGTASKKSDLDLLAIQETELSFFERLDGILKEIQLIVPYWGVDLLIYTPGELEKIRHRPFIKTILETGIVIYEHSQN